MTLEEQIEQLKDDYRRRVNTCDKMIRKYKGVDAYQHSRVEIKRGEYLAFLADLNNLKAPTRGT